MSPETSQAVIYDRNILSADLHAVTYERNSSAKQKSMGEQAIENRAAAEANGWTVVDQLSDPRSASRYATKARENWARLLAMLPTVDIVILWEPSRGDRSLATWAGFLDTCREHEVRVHVVTHQRTYDPRIARDYRSLAEDGVDSAYESDKTSARVRRGLPAHMAAGKPHGVLAYGYKRRYTERGTLIDQVPDPVTSLVVKAIYAAVAEGEPLHAVCIRLTNEGVATPKGGRVWYGSTLASIVRNPVYRPHSADPERGCRTHEGRVLDNPAAWPPLVDEVTWSAANRVLGGNDERARHARRDSAPGQVKYMLSGNADVMAAPCGSLLTGWSDAAGRGASYACRHDKCVSAPMPECDEYVSRLVVARLSRKDARHLWIADDTAVRDAAGELARLRESLAENQRAYEADEITAEMAGGKARKLQPLIDAAEVRSRPAGAPLAALKLIDAARMGKDRVRPMWDAFPVTARREVIAGIFSSLVLGPITERINRWTSPDERLAIVAERITHEWRQPNTPG